MQIRGRPIDLRYRFGRGGGVLFLTAPGLFYTFVNLVLRAKDSQFGVSDYARLHLFRRFLASVIVFCDVERISAEEEERLARIAAFWEKNSSAPLILNRPPRPQRRFSLLKTLYLRGINRKDLFRLDDPTTIDEVQFPCFIRDENGHLFGDPPRLLNSRDDLVAEIDAVRNRGETLYGKIVCEYEDTREADGGFAKYSYFKIGDKLIAGHRYEGDTWFLKHYTNAYIAAHPDSLQRERGFLDEKPFTDDVLEAFRIAQIDYGRIDFGRRLDGGIHIFEINTNPYHLHMDEVHPARNEHAAKTQDAIIAAFDDLVAKRSPTLLTWPRSV